MHGLVVVSLAALLLPMSGCIAADDARENDMREGVFLLDYDGGFTVLVAIQGPSPLTAPNGSQASAYRIEIDYGPGDPRAARAVEWYDGDFRLIAVQHDYPLCNEHECRRAPDLKYAVAGGITHIGFGLQQRLTHGAIDLSPAAPGSVLVAQTESTGGRSTLRLPAGDQAWPHSVEPGVFRYESHPFPESFAPLDADGAPPWHVRESDLGETMAGVPAWHLNRSLLAPSAAPGDAFPGAADEVFDHGFTHQEAIDAVVEHGATGCLSRYVAWADGGSPELLFGSRFDVQVDYGDSAGIWAYYVTYREGLLGRQFEVERHHKQTGVMDCDALSDGPRPGVSLTSLVDERPPFHTGDLMALVVDNRQVAELTDRPANDGWTTMGALFWPTSWDRSSPVIIGFPDEVRFDAHTGDLFRVVGPNVVEPLLDPRLDLAAPPVAGDTPPYHD